MDFAILSLNYPLYRLKMFDYEIYSLYKIGFTRCWSFYYNDDKFSEIKHELKTLNLNEEDES